MVKRVETISDITVFPKTDKNVECFQNYQKDIGALGYLTKAVPISQNRWVETN